MGEPIDDGTEARRPVADEVGTPRWVRVSLVIAAAAVLLLVVLLLLCGHGPGRHPV